VTERWAFTAEELRNPEGCRRDDVFVPHVGAEGGRFVGVLVDRRGKATNQYADGSWGVTGEDAGLAEANEMVVRLPFDVGEYHYVFECWDVVVDHAGGFVAFA
jgi:hypothetical protein